MIAILATTDTPHRFLRQIKAPAAAGATCCPARGCTHPIGADIARQETRIAANHRKPRRECGRTAGASSSTASSPRAEGSEAPDRQDGPQIPSTVLLRLIAAMTHILKGYPMHVALNRVWS